MDSYCGSSPFWNATYTWDTDNPYFTPCFIQSVFVWVPCFFLWLCTPFEVYVYSKSRYGNIPFNVLNAGRLVVATLLLANSLVSVGFAVSERNDGVDTQDFFVAAPAVKSATYLLSLLLIFCGKRKGIRSSYPLFIFWFLSSVEAVFTTRNVVHFGASDEFYYNTTAINCALSLLMFLMYCFADKEPEIYDEEYHSQNPCPELRSSSLARLTYHWMDGLMWKGFRNTLVVDDVFDLDPINKSKKVVPIFDKKWDEAVARKKNKKDKKMSIVPVLARAYGWHYFIGVVYKTIYDLLSFVSPQILSHLITFVTDHNEELWKGYFYAGIQLAVAVIQTLLMAQYTQRCYTTGMRFRSALTSAIYRKSLTMSNAAKKESTGGEIVNLMSVDTQRIMDFMSYITLLWSSPLILILSLYFLWQQIGIATLAGLAMLILVMPLNAVVATQLRECQTAQMKFKDQRVKTMTEVLGGMKLIKLFAWEPSFTQRVSEIRNQEISILKKMAKYMAVMMCIMFTSPSVVTLISFVTYLYMDGGSNILDANKAFVSLSLFSLMRMPLAMFPMVLVFMVQAVVSVNRINRFLNWDDIDPDNVGYNQNEVDPLIVEKGTFTWDTKEAPLLKNIDIRIKEGSLTAVVGSVGSGKSSLLSAMLGEMDKISGRINIKGTLAYAQQQAWIQNMSVRDNVLFGRSHNVSVYEKVIEACALKPDFQILPNGDQTEIGEKGINLSGGQKQRVSLARAVYSDSDTYLMDDPLSAVDSHVGKHIFDKVIGPEGILKNKTRVLVTHSIAFLPHVDNIIVMSNGEISEMGSYKQLLDRKGVFAEFLLEHLAKEELENDEILLEGGQDIKTQLEQAMGSHEFQRLYSKQMSRLSISSSRSGSINSGRTSTRTSIRRRGSRMSAATASTVIPEKPMEQGTLIQAETVKEGDVNSSVYIRYFKSMGLWISIAAIVFSGFSQAFSVMSSMWLSDWTDQIPDSHGNRATSTDTFVIVYAVLTVLQGISTYVSSLAYALGTLYATRRMHEIILSRIFRCPMSFFDTTPVGRIVNRFSKDVDTMDDTLPMNIRMFNNVFFSVIGSAFVIIYGTPWMAIGIVILLIVYYFIQKYYIITTRQLRRLESITKSPIYSHFGETISGAATIRAYKAQGRFIEDSATKVDTTQKCYYPSVLSSRWLSVRLETLGNLVVFATAVVAVIGRETMQPGVMGLVINYATTITMMLNMFVRPSSDVQTNMVAVERVQEYADLPEEPEWVIDENRPPKDWPKEGKVVFDNYQTRYREGLDLVLRGITCEVNSQEKIGIVGRTGAGKSSLTLALYRLIESAGGRIFIDGQDISRMGLHDLRNKLTIIPQDPVLFSGTIRTNLDPFGTYDDNKLWTALEHAHLKSFCESLTEGLSYTVTENGENLSVGQRQLLCLARALLRKTKVLILDEATAAVDLETDDLIQETIRDKFSDCTVLTIAHRLNTVMDYTKIMVLDQGQIREYDTPNNLLSNNRSMFYSMARDAGLV